MSRLTFKIFGFNIDPQFEFDSAIEWAQDLLSEGYNTNSIEILAGMSSPINYFEAVKLIEEAIIELEIDKYSLTERKGFYCAYFISLIADQIDVCTNVANVHSLYLKWLDESIFNFSLIYWARDDLIYRDNSEYWESANKENIEEITEIEARKWLLLNKMGEKEISSIFRYGNNNEE